MINFDDTVAVITGAASGIGLSLAQQLAEQGATVVIADIDGDAAARQAQMLGKRHRSVRLDVADPEAFLALAAMVRAELGGANLLVNNAGVAGPGGLPIWEATPADWTWVLGVNLLGVVNGIRAFMPQLLEAEQHGRPGHVLNTASLSGLLVFPMSGPYLAAKHAVVALSEQLGAELYSRGSNIGVSVVCPAWVRTGILDTGRPPTGAEGLTPAPAQEQVAWLRQSMAVEGLEPDTVAAAAIRAVQERRTCVLPRDMVPLVLERAAGLTKEAVLLPAPAGRD